MSSVQPRPELEVLPRRIRRLPVDGRGYPVPWFVAWIKGQPEFRVMDQDKWVRAVRERRCWVCGDYLGVYETFVIGPMCGINRTTAEPPSHQECAQWSARNCPFLARPHMVRRQDALTESLKENTAGISIDRNPGVTLLWTTLDYKVWRDPRGKPLIRMGEARSVSWWSQGRPATRSEVEASVDSGFPALLELARQEGEAAVQELQGKLARFKELYP